MLESLRGKLIVSCQALEDEPLHSSYIMGRMALAAKEGGASAIRANSVNDINEISKVVDLPIIGIIKREYKDSNVYITPTLKEVNELLSTRCEIIAVDATNRKRPSGESLKNILDLIHANDRLAMADCSTYEECIEADEMGFDIVSTTMFGYSEYSKKLDGPDFETMKKLSEELTAFFIAEGKINTPSDLKKVFEYSGVDSAVVGSAITRPQLITKKFTEVLRR